jgi:hypothetical protein
MEPTFFTVRREIATSMSHFANKAGTKDKSSAISVVLPNYIPIDCEGRENGPC